MLCPLKSSRRSHPGTQLTMKCSTSPPSNKSVLVHALIYLRHHGLILQGTSLLVQACFKFFALNTITRAENALQSEGTWRNSLSYNPFLKLLHQPHPQWEFLNPATFHFHQSCNVSFRGGCPGIPPPSPHNQFPPPKILRKINTYIPKSF